MFILQPPIIQPGQQAQTFHPQSAPNNNAFNPIPAVPQNPTYGQDTFIPNPNETPMERHIRALEEGLSQEHNRIMTQPPSLRQLTPIEKKVNELQKSVSGQHSSDSTEIQTSTPNNESSESSGTFGKLAAAGTTATQFNLRAAKFVKNTRDITDASKIGFWERIFHPLKSHATIKAGEKVALEASTITKGALTGSKALGLVSKLNYVLAPIAGWSAVSDCWSDINEAAYFDDYAKLDGKLSEEEINDIQSEKAWCATANTTFTAVGAGIGLFKGMAAGAAIGTVVGGPIGTIVGGILGACAGAGIGSLVGNIAKSFIAKDGIGHRIFKTLFGSRTTSKDLYREKLKEIEKAKKAEELNQRNNIIQSPGMVPVQA